MYRDRSKLLPIVLVAVIAIIAIVAMVSLGRALLNRGDTTEVADDPAKRALLTTEADRSVRMSVRGPIVAEEDFRSYEIEVSPISRRMTVFQGYQRDTVETERLSNNTEAYTEFVNALSRASFTSEADVEDPSDVEGACANGRLYTFELLRAQSVIEEYWITSCRNVPSSYKGEAVVIRDLFLEQIPNHRELLKDIDL